MKEPNEELEIVLPGKVPTLGNFQVLGTLDEKQMAAIVAEKLREIELHDAAYRYGAMQLGVALVMWQETLPHGRFLAFIRDNFGSAKSTLYNYISGAKRFLLDAGFSTSAALAPPDKIAPILDTQLDLFTGDGAALSSAAAKFKKWIGKRSLGDICEPGKPGGKTYDRKDASGKLVAGKGAQKITPAQLRAHAMKQAAEIVAAMHAFTQAAHHTRLCHDQAGRDVFAALKGGVKEFGETLKNQKP